MPRFHEPTFTELELSKLHDTVANYKRQGMQFVQICATAREDSCDLLYAFTDPEAEKPGLTGLVVNVPDGAQVPSVTDCYPAAFVFENETHDLFGVDIADINIDFGGEFYTVAVKYPMNPRAALREEEAAKLAEEEAAAGAEPAAAQAGEEAGNE